MAQYNTLNVKLSNCPHKLLLTNRQVSKICKANGSSANIKFLDLAKGVDHHLLLKRLI